jgi:hypothetical protein
MDGSWSEFEATSLGEWERRRIYNGALKAEAETEAEAANGLQ